MSYSRRNAVDALVDLRAELSLVQEVPVLICVDECNWLYEPTAFHYMGEQLMPSQMIIAALFRTFSEKSYGSKDTVEALELSLRPPLNTETGSFELHASTERYERTTDTTAGNFLFCA